MERINEKRTMFTGGRDYSVDILRCISCLLVVTGHVTDLMLPDVGYASLEVGSATCYALQIIHCVSIAATNIFLMISGIFFLSPERNVTPVKIWSKNVLKLTCAYILWSAIYALFRIYYENPQPFSGRIFIREWLIQEAHLWYIPMMIGIYILVPVLRVFTLHAERKHYHYLFAIFAGGVLLNTIRICSKEYVYPFSKSVIAIVDKTPVDTICIFSIFPIVGYYFYTYRLSKKVRMIIYLLGLLGVLISFFSCLFTWNINEQLEGGLLYHKFAIGNILKTIAIFLLVITAFSDVKLSEKVKKFISKLSASTLFIYLFHWLMMRVLFKEGFLLDSGINCLILDLIYIFLIYFTGFAISFVFLQCIPWVDMRNVVLDKIWPNRKLYVTKKKK